MAATNIKLPPVPTEDLYRYKHYLIRQDKNLTGTFHLHLWRYEPISLGIQKSNVIFAANNEAANIDFRIYTYSTGQDAWVFSNNYKTLTYAEFNGLMVYNNFAFNLKDVQNENSARNGYYESNPMPDDGVVIPEIEPEFPKIPNEHSFRFKHYQILRNKVYPEKINLYIWEYEPSVFEVDDNGTITAYQKYGERIGYRNYTYEIGRTEEWTNVGGSWLSYGFSLKSYILVHNNYPMELGEEYYDINPLPDDQLIPVPEPEFPVIPYVHNFQYKHYYIVQDKSYLEKYQLYLLKYDPVSFAVGEDDYMVAYQKYGEVIGCRAYDFTIGQTAWKINNTNSSTAHLQKYDKFMDAVVHNNIVIDYEEQHYELNPFAGSGLIPAPEPRLPSIPYLHNFQYKHYYIVQNKSDLGKYHVYLFEYEPILFNINEKGHIVAYQKYGREIQCKAYTYEVGKDEWKASSNYQLYSDLEATLLYNNFNLNVEEMCYEVNPMPDDQVVPAVDLELPSIPNLHVSQYKHYYIVQHKTILDYYKLYLMQYEPVSMELDDSNFIVSYQKYGKKINCKTYDYKIGEEQWKTGFRAPYSDIALVYNNSAVNINEDHYDKNPMPDDQLEPSLEVQIPGIPYVHNFQYKHYYIVQNKTFLDRYHLYLLKYEPACFEINKDGYMVAYERYQNAIGCNIYDYNIGQNEWTRSGGESGRLQSYEDFTNALVYNNTAIDVEEYYKVNPLPDDQVIPALESELPAVPIVTTEASYRYYVLLEENEFYELNLLKDEPVNYSVGTGNAGDYVRFLNKSGKAIDIKKYRYTLGDAKWTAYANVFTSINISSMNHSGEYCNFNITIADPQSTSGEEYLSNIPCNRYHNDGVGIGTVRNGWTKINKGWYYYVNGKRQFGWIKTKQLRTDQIGQVSYCAKEFNGVRTENGTFRIDGSQYLFQVNGTLVTAKNDDFEFVQDGKIRYIIYADGKIYGQSPVYVEGTAIFNTNVFERFPYGCGGDTMGTIEEGTIVKIHHTLSETKCYQNKTSSLPALDMHYIMVEYGDKYGYVDCSKLRNLTHFNRFMCEFKYKQYVVKVGTSEMTVTPGGIRMIKLSKGDKVDVVTPEEKKWDSGILWTKIFYYNGFRWVPDEDIREWTWDDEYELYKLKTDTIFYNNDAGEICKLLKGTEVTVVKGREIPNFSTDIGFISVVEIHYGNTYGWIDKRDLGEKLTKSEGSGDVFSEWAKTNRTEKIKFLEPFVQLAKDEELRTGVPWQVTLGQIAYETGWGDEDKKIYDEYTKAYSYNLFGVKYTGSVNDTSKFVRTWTTEYINSSDLEKWKKEHSKWALNNDSLVNEGTVNGKLKIKIIQPFRRYTSYDDSIIDHTNVLEHERYSSANEYKNNPFIYVSIIGPIYATGPDYGDTASIIMNDYFAWHDKEADWEEYNNWKSSR